MYKPEVEITLKIKDIRAGYDGRRSFNSFTNILKLKNKI